MSQIIELLEKARSVARVAEPNKAGYECIEQHIEQALTLLEQQPTAGDFTSNVRLNLVNWKEHIPGLFDVRVRTIIKWLEEACDHLDISEASRKDLLKALRKYGNHKLPCKHRGLNMREDWSCTCGLSTAISKAKKLVTK